MIQKLILAAICGICLLAAPNFEAFAQGPRGGDEGRSGEGRGGPRERPRNGDFGAQRGPRRPNEKRRLGRLWRDIAHLEKGKNALSPMQAAQIVVLVLPWSKKPAMSESAAQTLHRNLEAVLTKAQKTALENGPFGGPPRDGRPRDGRPRDGGLRDGGPRDGGLRDRRPPRDDGRRDFGDFGGPPPPRQDENGPRGERPRPPREGFDGPPPPREGADGPRRGGPPEMRGLTAAQGAIVRAWMQTTHPFYAPTGYANWKKLPPTFAQNSARRYREDRATLEALSRKSRR